MLATLSASVKQLEIERDQLLEQLKHQEQHEREQQPLHRNLPGELLLLAFFDKERNGLLSCVSHTARM
jgi:hypothetical protein